MESQTNKCINCGDNANSVVDNVVPTIFRVSCCAKEKLPCSQVDGGRSKVSKAKAKDGSDNGEKKMQALSCETDWYPEGSCVQNLDKVENTSKIEAGIIAFKFKEMLESLEGLARCRIREVSEIKAGKDNRGRGLKRKERENEEEIEEPQTKRQKLDDFGEEN